MKALLIYPLFPKSFWSFDKAIELAGRKAILPPLGLVTVAGILPESWGLRLVDRDVGELTEAGRGGAYATAPPNEAIEAGADCRVLDEGEITLPMLVEAIEKGETEGTFRALERPDVSASPVPR